MWFISVFVVAFLFIIWLKYFLIYSQNNVIIKPDQILWRGHREIAILIPISYWEKCQLFHIYENDLNKIWLNKNLFHLHHDPNIVLVIITCNSTIVNHFVRSASLHLDAFHFCVLKILELVIPTISNGFRFNVATDLNNKIISIF